MTPLRCDICKRFIPMNDFAIGVAKRRLLTPASEFTAETWETLCKHHSEKDAFKEIEP